MSVRAAVVLLAVVLAAVVLAAAGCTQVESLSVPVPPAAGGAAAATTTTPAPATTVPEAPVAGSAPSSTVAVGPGTAQIDGTVFGPAGPVEGVTVQAQRFVGDEVGTIQVATAADGSFNIPAIRGGRYEIRAWQVPSLTEATPQVFFLAAGTTRTLEVHLTSYANLQVATALAPAKIFTGQPVNLAVLVTQSMVGADGRVRQVPQPSVLVQLVSAGFVPYGGGPSSVTTGDDGRAVMELVCSADGAGTIMLLVGGSKSVALPTQACVDPESTTTTTVPPASFVPATFAPPTSAPTSSTSAPGPVTSTTVPGESAASLGAGTASLGAGTASRGAGRTALGVGMPPEARTPATTRASAV